MSVLVPLEYRGNPQHRRVEIDGEDWPRIQGYSWRWQPPSERAKQSEGYAMASVSKGGVTRAILLHRLLLDAKSGQVVTFRDRNGLNCKRENLLIGSQGLATALSGARKSQTGLRGVRMHGSGFRATVTHNKVPHQSRTFRTIQEANDWAEARRAEMHGAAIAKATQPTKPKP